MSAGSIRVRTTYRGDKEPIIETSVARQMVFGRESCSGQQRSKLKGKITGIPWNVGDRQ